MIATEKPTVFRFGAYTADLRLGELRKLGTRLPVQIQPFQVLSVFLERPNELITREELQKKLWPSDTFVDFDHGLNKAINKLRDALCDTAEDPRFIETVPRRGYRFVAPVTVETPPAIEPEPETLPDEAPVNATWTTARTPKARHLVLWSFALAAVVAAVYFSLPRVTENSPSPKLAVLPLASTRTTADYDVADGVTDGLIQDLSGVPGLRVISHVSVFRYRDKQIDPVAVGRDLRVTEILTGKVEQDGNTLNITLELASAKDGSHIWGQRYTRDISERATLQREIVASVEEALRPDFANDPQNPIRRAQSSPDADAQQLYNNGRYYFFKETQEDVLKARDLFIQARDKDPSYALPWAALGDTFDWMATEGFQPLDEVVGQSAQAKRRALELDRFRAETHCSVAALEMVQWHWLNAEAEYQRGLALNPNYSEGHLLYSIYLRTMKRFPEAIEHATLFTEIDPLSMQAKSNLALTYYYARQFEAAAREYRLILKDYPNTPSAHAGLASVLLRMGQLDKGIDEWAQALSLAGDEPSAANLRRAFALGGLSAARATVLRSEINTLKQAAADSYVSPLEFAYRYALLNETENAFRWLERAYTERSPQLFNLNVDPDYDSLRDDPRFADLLARLHVPS